MTAAILRPARHAKTDRRPAIVEILVALLCLLCELVTEHDSALERFADFTNTVVRCAFVGALFILPWVTR